MNIGIINCGRYHIRSIKYITRILNFGWYLKLNKVLMSGISVVIVDLLPIRITLSTRIIMVYFTRYRSIACLKVVLLPDLQEWWAV
jgi:hypothetical protein